MSDISPAEAQYTRVGESCIGEPEINIKIDLESDVIEGLEMLQEYTGLALKRIVKNIIHQVYNKYYINYEQNDEDAYNVKLYFYDEPVNMQSKYIKIDNIAFKQLKTMAFSARRNTKIFLEEILITELSKWLEIEEKRYNDGWY